MSNLQLTLERIYLKDASFESPVSPDIFAGEWKPEMRLDINTRANNLSENRVEVLLRATAEAQQTGGSVAFICEVVQAGVFVFEGGEGQQRHQALGTMCPTMLFPYVRETMDSLVVKGGFPALQLAPVNFDALYQEALRQQEASDDQVKH